MTKYFLLILFMFNCSLMFSQRYSDEYIDASFKVTDWEDFKNRKINPRSIINLRIENLGEEKEISKYPIEKLRNLEILYLEGNDSDYWLKTIPKEFLKIKSLKIIILERMEHLWSVVNSIKLQRPDIEIKFMYYDATIKHIPNVNDTSARYALNIKIVYPKKPIFPFSFEVDSILRKEKKNNIDNLILAEAFVDDLINSNYQKLKYLQMGDSLNSKYSDSDINIENLIPFNYIETLSMKDTTRSLYYLNQVIKSNENNNNILYYICSFYYKNMKDRNKACLYYDKIKGTIIPENDIIYSSYYRIFNKDVGFYPEDIEEFCNK